MTYGVILTRLRIVSLIRSSFDRVISGDVPGALSINVNKHLYLS